MRTPSSRLTTSCVSPASVKVTGQRTGGPEAMPAGFYGADHTPRLVKEPAHRLANPATMCAKSFAG